MARTKSEAAAERVQPAERSVERSSRESFTGAKGGFVATVVMTAYRLPVARSLPPTDEFWTRYVSRDAARRAVLPAILLHLLYGSAAGAAYAVLAPGPTAASEERAELRGVFGAVAYGVLLSVFGERVLLEGLLDQELAPDERLVFHLGHVVYGITLGTWIGSRRNG